MYQALRSPLTNIKVLVKNTPTSTGEANADRTIAWLTQNQLWVPLHLLLAAARLTLPVDLCKEATAKLVTRAHTALGRDTNEKPRMTLGVAWAEL